MRVGIVSPYSYTYPGGVGRHAEALAHELRGRHGGYDIHVQEPSAPIVSWFATEAARMRLVREGMSWRELRLRALHATPVELVAVGRSGREAVE